MREYHFCNSSGSCVTGGALDKSEGVVKTDFFSAMLWTGGPEARFFLFS